MLPRLHDGDCLEYLCTSAYIQIPRLLTTPYIMHSANGETACRPTLARVGPIDEQRAMSGFARHIHFLSLPVNDEVNY